MLRPDFDVRVTQQWPDAAAGGDDIMIALHARRSAPAVQAWAQHKARASLALVLTGTDLYDDLARDADARQSVALAARLVVLQELGGQALPANVQSKVRVIFQSTTTRRTLAKSTAHLTALMVGHLREVKSPETFFDAAQLLKHRGDIRLHHIGGADAAWAERARTVQAECANYRWLGALEHGATRAAIQRAHVLVHPSRLEGGAHVVMEAVCSGTPVLASQVAGNVGMLGPDYEGYFPAGDAQALAALLQRCRQDQARGEPGASLLGRLREQCAKRAALFAPQAERAAVLRLAGELRD